MKKPVQLAIVIVCLAASAVLVMRHYRHPEPLREVAANFLENAGRGIAERAARLSGGQGKILLVKLSPPPTDDPSADDPIVAAFKKALKAQPGLLLAGVEEVGNQDPAKGAFVGWTAGSYLALLTKYPDVNVIVSFAGAPQFGSDALRQLPAQHPPLIVARDDFGTVKRALFDAGVVQEAILRRANPAAAKSFSTSFADNYEVITAQTASQLP
jgi:ABC-type sugar transport system substrate-binding protein